MNKLVTICLYELQHSRTDSICCNVSRKLCGQICRAASACQLYDLSTDLGQVRMLYSCRERPAGEVTSGRSSSLCKAEPFWFGCSNPNLKYKIIEEEVHIREIVQSLTRSHGNVRVPWPR